MDEKNEGLSYNLSKIKRLLLLAKNACKQLPEIENFPLEPQKKLTINDIIDKKVVKLDKLLPLVKNGKFDYANFMQMIKDVPYTIKPQERHLKTRDGKVYDDKFQLIEVAFDNGITLTHQYQFVDDKFSQRNYDEAQEKIQKSLSGEYNGLGDVIITNADSEEIQCSFQQDGKIWQIKDAKKNVARFHPFNMNLEILDYNDVIIYFSPREKGEGCFASIIENIKTGICEHYREDDSLYLYDNDRLREHFIVKDDGTKIFRKDEDIVSYRADDTLRDTWDGTREIGTMYKEDGKTIDYTWDKTKKRTYYNNTDSKDKSSQRPVEINNASKAAFADRMKTLGAKIVPNPEYPRTGHSTEEEFKNSDVAELQKDNLNNSKLATIRKKIAHGIDEKLGTNLEEKKLAKPLKKIEKAVSDKLFGKAKE